MRAGLAAARRQSQHHVDVPQGGCSASHTCVPRIATGIHLVHGAQHRGHRALDHFVFQRRQYPPHRLRPVTPAVHPIAQLLQPLLQIPLVALDRFPMLRSA